MMDWCSRDASATDYTVQASAVVMATCLASAGAGFSAQALGYFGHFCLATVMALAALVAVHRCFPAADAIAVNLGQTKEAAPCA